MTNESITRGVRSFIWTWAEAEVVQSDSRNINVLDAALVRRKGPISGSAADRLIINMRIAAGIDSHVELTGYTKTDFQKCKEYVNRLRNIRDIATRAVTQKLTYRQATNFYGRQTGAYYGVTFEELIWHSDEFKTLRQEYEHFMQLVRLYPAEGILRHIKKLDLFGMAFYEACQKQMANQDYIDHLDPSVSFESVMTVMHKKIHRLQLAGIHWPDEIFYAFQNYPIPRKSKIEMVRNERGH